MVEARLQQEKANTVKLWTGLLVDIPAGWALCDGSGGRPDLRDKFVVGASIWENPGGTGGSLTKSHGGAAVATHTNVAVPQTGTASVKGGTSTSVLAAAQIHTHTIASITHSVTQPSDHPDIRPPFYKVAFIIKL